MVQLPVACEQWTSYLVLTAAVLKHIISEPSPSLRRQGIASIPCFLNLMFFASSENYRANHFLINDSLHLVDELLD
jgi:hypothetical protein